MSEVIIDGTELKEKALDLMLMVDQAKVIKLNGIEANYWNVSWADTCNDDEDKNDDDNDDNDDIYCRDDEDYEEVNEKLIFGIENHYDREIPIGSIISIDVLAERSWKVVYTENFKEVSVNIQVFI
jgi:hypothetical protein